MTPLLKRYMYIIAEEFLNEFKEVLSNFDGDVGQFSVFEDVVEDYFEI